MKRSQLVGSFELKALDETKRTFEGALSTSHIDSGYAGQHRDIVHPGAFKRSLDHFKSAKDPYIPLLDTHSQRSVMDSYGHMLDGEERLTGNTLRYEKADGGVHEVPEMMLDTQWQVIDGIDGERLLDRLRSKAVRKMSMGYQDKRSDYTNLKDYGKTRNLREVALGEGSLVLSPMNPTADVNLASVKSLLDAAREGTLTDEQKDELRALLRDPSAPAEQPPADTPKGLAPNDPARIALDAQLRALKLRSLIQ
jgi:HK97 family phage prohead protease